MTLLPHPPKQFGLQTCNWNFLRWPVFRHHLKWRSITSDLSTTRRDTQSWECLTHLFSFLAFLGCTACSGVLIHLNCSSLISPAILRDLHKQQWLHVCNDLDDYQVFTLSTNEVRLSWTPEITYSHRQA